MKQLYIVILSIFSLIAAQAQDDSTNLVKYDFSFEFKEGIYLSFDNFKNNNPIPYEAIISPEFSDDFFNNLDTADNITFYGEFGSPITIPIDKLWGYSKNGKPYILWAEKFNLIPFIGSISHFITTVKVYYSTFHDPFYDPYSYNPGARVYQSDELRQLLIDMQTGQIIDYNLKNVEALLKRDAQVYEEFMKLGKRKRAKQMFYYVKYFNEKNPLYLQE
ncbi:MAG: hypothetical protein JXL97_09875 [Bacteroidales bacterium]|nr:hypothetical protein [Bacteroidales bacterium]